jgi:hypothetical protein
MTHIATKEQLNFNSLKDLLYFLKLQTDENFNKYALQYKQKNPNFEVRRKKDINTNGSYKVWVCQTKHETIKKENKCLKN